MATASDISVLLVEDHAFFRHGLKELLEDVGIRVAGEAADGLNAVRLARELSPDVVLMDLHMPRMDGVEATAQIVELEEPPAVLVLTVSTTTTDVLDALAAGAAGYLLKDSDADELVRAVHAAASGRTPLAPAVAGAVVQRVREQDPPREPAQELPPLSPRETEILRMLAEGCDNGEIAERLYLSPSTVKNHVSRILEKLGVESRVQAAVRAARAGIV